MSNDVWLSMSEHIYLYAYAARIMNTSNMGNEWLKATLKESRLDTVINQVKRMNELGETAVYLNATHKVFSLSGRCWRKFDFLVNLVLVPVWSQRRGHRCSVWIRKNRFYFWFVWLVHLQLKSFDVIWWFITETTPSFTQRTSNRYFFMKYSIKDGHINWLYKSYWLIMVVVNWLSDDCSVFLFCLKWENRTFIAFAFVISIEPPLYQTVETNRIADIK